MQNRTRVIASALFATLLAGVIAIVGSNAARSEECLSAPGKQTPAGAHWRFRTDHAHHHCWFLKSDSGKDLGAGETEKDADAVPATQPQASEDLPQSTADAHAEMQASTRPAPTTTAASPAPAAQPAATAQATPTAPPQQRSIGYMGVQPTAPDQQPAVASAPTPGPVEFDSMRIKTVPVHVADNGDAAPTANAPDATAPKEAAPAEPQTAAAMTTVGAAPMLDQASGSILLIGLTLIGTGVTVIVGSLIVMLIGAARSRRHDVVSG